MWALGALALVWLVPSQPVAVAGLALATLWSGMEIVEFDQHIHWPFLVVWGLFLPPALYREWKWATSGAVIALGVWCIMVFFNWGHNLRGQHLFLLETFVLLGAALHLAGTVMLDHPRLAPLSTAVRRPALFGALLAALGFLSVGIHGLPSWMWGNDGTGGNGWVRTGAANNWQVAILFTFGLMVFGLAYLSFRKAATACHPVPAGPLWRCRLHVCGDQRHRLRCADLADRTRLPQRRALPGLLRLHLFRARVAHRVFHQLLAADGPLAADHDRRRRAGWGRLHLGAPAPERRCGKGARRVAMKKYRVPLLALVVVLQTATLVGMVAIKHRTLITGTPVLLRTEPVDPRSLFRGDYVILDYAIGRLAYDTVEGDNAFGRYDDVYVVLRQGETYWEPVSIHHDMPAREAESVVIRGTVKYSGVWIGGEKRDGINVRYGIESYFVPEGEGREIELPRNEGKVAILVAVDGDGAAAIKAVLIDGMVRYQETLL
jgi:uncharacterized membrane-anchored protein